MLLAIDIGNTSIKFGVFDGEHLLSKFSIPTKRDSTSDELKTAIGSSLDLPLSSAIICSVVPEIENSIEAFLREAAGIQPFFVRNDFDFGLKINYEPLSAAGTDRLVNAFAAKEKYGAPCIVISLGTATTIDVVNANRELLGGVIAPGMATMAKALHLNTSKLPEVEIKKPERVISNTTVDSIQSGVFYGHISMVKGLLRCIESELLSEPGTVVTGSDFRPRVIATGGFSDFLAPEIDAIEIPDNDLNLDGLRLIHKQIITS